MSDMYIGNMIGEVTNVVGLIEDVLNSASPTAASVQLLRDRLKQLGQELNRTEAMHGMSAYQWADALNFGVCITDAAGVIQHINGIYARDVQSTPAAARGRREQDLFPDPPSDDFIMSKQVMETGKLTYFPTRRPGNNGIVMGVPIYEDGVLTNIVIMVMNETYLTNISRMLSMDDMETAESNFKVTDELFYSFIGRTAQMERIRARIRKIAPTDATVLISGESGCGKEVVADNIYRLSSRSKNPYVKINCAAIPPNLLESELFGYKRGAFTGASSAGKPGLLEQADKGTVFLDEIGDFPMELQPKLLRFLQNGEIYQVGASTPTRLDVRVIAATNSNLKLKIADGRFREDLYYRLNVIPIQVPPLRERKNDIWNLTNHFLKIYCDKYQRNIQFSDGLMRQLEAYDWPGNVRELQHIVEYMVICWDEDPAVMSECLSDIWGGGASSLALDQGFNASMDAYGRGLIEEALRTSPSVMEAARRLNISRSSMYRKARKYGIAMEEMSEGELPPELDHEENE